MGMNGQLDGIQKYIRGAPLFGRMQVTKRSTHARLGMQMQQCLAVLLRWPKPDDTTQICLFRARRLAICRSYAIFCQPQRGPHGTVQKGV